ncbi:MAG: glycosyltransferase family 4 protein [Labilithrix sp.]
MRVVHLTTEFPWPATSGGPVRTTSQLRIVASLPEVESITLVSLTEGNVPTDHIEALEHAFDADAGKNGKAKLHVVRPVFHPIHLFDFKSYVPRVVALRLLGVPYLAGKWDSRDIRNTLREQLSRVKPDVVYVDHLGMATYLPDIRAVCPRARVVVDQHNVESDFFKQFAEEQTGPKKIVAKMEWKRAAAFEKRVLREVNAVVAISNEDARVFESFAGVRAHVVPVVMTFERRSRPHPGRPHFCYVGSLRWKPNVLGLDWFCQKVWPLVRQKIPDATFEIAGVGLKPDPETGKLPIPAEWQGPGIRTVGFLEDLEPLYERSLGMIAPITGGSGVRMKLLEGFRAGMPVVTTPDGAFGLPLVDGRDALISADPQGFADRVARLANDDALRDHLREGGYAFLEKFHSLAVAQNIMRGALGVPTPG